jgi:DNA polymerase zeta
VNQEPLDVIPLVIEPERQFYVDPVIVLDFQSLDPSIIISHNLCYSTCLGKIAPADKPTKKYEFANSSRLGVAEMASALKRHFGYSSDHALSEENIKEIVESVIIAPNLVAYVKPHVPIVVSQHRSAKDCCHRY